MTMGLDFENFVSKDFMKAIYFAVRCPKKPKVAPPMTSPAAIEIKAMVASAFLNKIGGHADGQGTVHEGC